MSMTVVEERCLPEGSESLRRHATPLASASGVALLTVRFTDGAPGARLVGADPWPPLDDAVTEAIFAHLRKRAAERRP